MFATTKVYITSFLGFIRQWNNTRVLMRTITERLVLRQSTSTPVIRLALFHCYLVRCKLSNLWEFRFQIIRCHLYNNNILNQKKKYEKVSSLKSTKRF